MAALLTPPDTAADAATELEWPTFRLDCDGVERTTVVHRPRRTATTFLGIGVAVVALAVAVIVVVVERDPSALVLVTDGEGGVAALDPVSGLSTFSVDQAAVSADGSTLYQAQPDGNTTTLRQIDPATGAPGVGVALDGELAIRTVSADGDAAVLMAPRETTGLYVPESRATTSLTVYWRDRLEPATFELAGNFEPEAFTTDEQTLYLLEFWPPLAPDRYFVRRLDLASGSLADVYSPEVELGPEMRGQARAQVMAPDHTFLYTLYTIPRGDAPVVDPSLASGDGGERWAFVHVLSLTDDWSFCVFLPVPIGTSAPESVTLTMTPDGRSLYVVDPSTQHVAVIDVESLTVRSSTHVPTMSAGFTEPGQTSDRAIAAVTDDGVLYVGDRYSVIGYTPDMATQTVWVGPADTGQRITDLDVTADGTQLRIGLEGRAVVWDPVQLREIATFDVPGDGAVSFAGPPGALLSWGDVFKCAC